MCISVCQRVCVDQQIDACTCRREVVCVWVGVIHLFYYFEERWKWGLVIKSNIVGVALLQVQMQISAVHQVHR